MVLFFGLMIIFKMCIAIKINVANKYTNNAMIGQINIDQMNINDL
jgi:hypothetical protein